MSIDFNLKPIIATLNFNIINFRTIYAFTNL
ncbi:hypothetical protein J468_4208, partial [Acinetobacter baumannii 1043903]